MELKLAARLSEAAASLRSPAAFVVPRRSLTPALRRRQEFLSSEDTGYVLDIAFTDVARQMLTLAGEEANRLGHEYIGTEHLVLAVTRQTDGSLGTTLRRLRVDRESVRALIESTVRPGPVTTPGAVVLPYTSRTYKVFAVAKESAQALGAREVGAEHLLLGVLREAMGVGGQVLAHYGLSEAAALEEIKRITRGEAKES